DITAVPKRHFIRELANFTKDERERERLLGLARPNLQHEYYDYAVRPRRTILELLRDFPAVRIPFSHCIDLFPLIRGREFSLASAGKGLAGRLDKPGDLNLDILAALVEYKTVIRKPRQGLCSRYLKTLEPGAKLRIGLKIPHEKRCIIPH